MMKKRNVEELKVDLLSRLDEELAMIEEEQLNSIKEQEKAFAAAKDAIESEKNIDRFMLKVEEKISQINDKRAVLEGNKKVTTYFNTLALYAKRQESKKIYDTKNLVDRNTQTVEVVEPVEILPKQRLSYTSVYCIVAVGLTGLGILAAMNLINREDDTSQLENNDYNNLFTYGYDSIRCGINNIVESRSAQQNLGQSLPKNTL